MNIIFTGARSLKGLSRDVVETKIAELVDSCVEREPTTVYVGCADGVDALVRAHCLKRRVPCTVYTADDRFPETPGLTIVRVSDWRRDGRRAGPMRNEKMVHDVRMASMVPISGGGLAALSVLCCAFPDQESVGTWGCAKLAFEAGFTVQVVDATVDGGLRVPGWWQEAQSKPGGGS